MLRIPHQHGMDPDLDARIGELLEESSRVLVYATLAAYLGAALLISVMVPERYSNTLWLMAPLVGLLSVIVLKLIRHDLRIAQGVWQVGLTALFVSCLVLYRIPSIAWLLVMLPFMAVNTVGWMGGVASEGLIIAATCVLSLWPGAELLPSAYIAAVGGGGAFTGLIAWAASQSQQTLATWSYASYQEAQRYMQDARERRAHLAQVVGDLDRAYYRLERANAALIAAWRATSEVEAFKVQFATSLSHELRTPLNLIIGFCEMMLTAPEKYEGAAIPRPYRSDLNAVYRSAQHLVDLLNDILDLAQIDAGKLSLRREEVDVVSIVREATDMVCEYIKAKGLVLETRINENLPKLWLDRLRIRQVLLNLLVNAVRFTESGTITVTTGQDCEQVVVRVSDTGQGIPPGRLPRIFDEFNPPGNPSAERWPGTGLGLPISRKLIELHGGHIDVESTYLKGTTFSVSFPCISAAQAAEVEPKLHTLIRTEPVRQLPAHKRVVIVVHEDQRMVSMVQRHLADYRIIGGSDLAEGVALAHEHAALALVTDGVDKPTDLPDDLLWIGCSLPNTHRTAQALGVHGYLIKPVDPEGLAAAMDGIRESVRRVLIVDDDANMVKLLTRMLGPAIAPQDCLEAHNGAEAWEILRAERPDLVLLDLMMPEGSGLELIGRIRAEAVASTPVIVVSAMEPDQLGPRLPGILRVQRSEGLSAGDVLGAVEANLAVLSRGWH